MGEACLATTKVMAGDIAVRALAEWDDAQDSRNLGSNSTKNAAKRRSNCSGRLIY